jgi:hypothetical protein
MDMSAEEIKMFSDLGWVHLVDKIEIMPLYQMAVEKAFVDENTNVDAVMALQRAIKHFRAGKYRGNDEFNKLITY